MMRCVVLLKHRFLGDAIMATPLIAAVKQVYPESELTVVTGNGAGLLLANHPAITAIRTYGPGTADRTPEGARQLMRRAWALAGELRHTQRPDTVFVVDRSLRAALLAWRMGAEQRIGFNTEGRGILLTHRVKYDPNRPETECTLDLLRAIAPGPYLARPRLFVTPEERQAGRALLPEGHLVGLQPGASHAYKQWPLERLAALGEQLYERQRVRLVLIGGSDEVPAAEALKALLKRPVAVDLTGKTALRETMGVLANLTLFLGNDTGVNHIAAALGIPNITLFGPTPAHKWGWSGPYNRTLIAADGKMESLDVEAVYGAAAELLA